MKIADLQSMGYLPFRHEEVIDPDLRNAVYGLRFVKHDDKTAEVETKDHGDLQFAHFLERVEKKRWCGSWSLATPSVWMEKGPLPIKDDKFSEDERYKNIPAKTYGGRTYADGTPGLVMGASKETKEEKVFYSFMGDLVAHHEGKNAPEYSTLVYDIDAQGRIDIDRKAGLHSTFWVKRMTNRLGAIAWNLTKSKGDETGWGLFTSLPGAQIKKIGRSVQRGQVVPAIMAYASHEKSGPLHPGSSSDVHFLKNTLDGPINAGHLDWQAYFFCNTALDGPLLLEPRLYPGAKKFPFSSEVHLVWDPAIPHDFVGGGGKGKWRWYAEVPMTMIEIPPGLPPGEPPGRPPKDPKKPGRLPPKKPGDPITPGDPDGGGETPEPPWTPATPNHDPRWGPAYPPVVGGKGKPSTTQKKKDHKKKPLAIAGMVNKLLVPGILIQAHPARTKEKFDKYRPGSDAWVEKWYKALKRGLEKDWPGTIQIEGYGKEKTPGIFTKTTGQVDRYPMGTGQGGLIISPPEMGMDDYDSGFSPPIDTVSDTYVTFLSAGKALGKTFLAFGSPDLDTGGIHTGFRLAQEDTDLWLRGIDSSGSADLTRVLNMNVKVVHNGAWQYASGAGAGKVWTSDASGNGSWGASGGSGDVVGPASATDNAIARFDTTTGKLIQNSQVTIADTGDTVIYGDTSPGLTLQRITTDGDSGYMIWEGMESTTPATVSPRRWKVRDEISIGSRDHSLVWYGEDPTGAGGTFVKLTEFISTGGGTKMKMGTFPNGELDMNLNSVSNCVGIGGGTGNLDISASLGGEVTINDGASDVNLRIEGLTESSLFLIDAGNDEASFFTSGASILGNTFPVSIKKTSSLGFGMGILHTLSSPSASDRGDGALYVEADMSANSATNELVLRALQLSVKNNLTGGGILQNARCFNLATHTSLSTTVTNLSHLYLEAGTTSGTVTNGYGLYINNLQGTTKYGIYDSSGGHWSSTGGYLQINAATGTTYRADIGGACHASSFPVSSDEKLKENIEGLEIGGSILAKLMKIRGVRFDWNRKYRKHLKRAPGLMGRTSEKEIGFVAQEVALQFPELCSKWKQKFEDDTKTEVEEEYYAVDYSRMVAVLVEGIKELTFRVKKLEARK